MNDHLRLIPDPSDPAGWSLDGELDLDTAAVVVEAFGRDLALPAGTTVRVSCAALTFIDLTGLDALVRARHRAARRGVRLEIVDPSPALRLLLAQDSTREMLQGESSGG